RVDALAGHGVDVRVGEAHAALDLGPQNGAERAAPGGFTFGVFLLLAAGLQHRAVDAARPAVGDEVRYGEVLHHEGQPARGVDVRVGEAHAALDLGPQNGAERAAPGGFTFGVFLLLAAGLQHRAVDAARPAVGDEVRDGEVLHHEGQPARVVDVRVRDEDRGE